MEVFLIFPKSKQARQELGQELAKFQSEQALKTVQKLPCSTDCPRTLPLSLSVDYAERIKREACPP